MISPCRILRFRLRGSAAPTGIDGRILLEICVNEAPVPAGYVIELAATHGAPVRWSYILAGGQPTGLQSVISRRDLEAQIQDSYFLAMTADDRQSA